MYSPAASSSLSTGFLGHGKPVGSAETFSRPFLVIMLPCWSMKTSCGKREEGHESKVQIQRVIQIQYYSSYTRRPLIEIYSLESVLVCFITVS